MNTFQKFIGILLIVVGVTAAGIVVVRSTLYDPDNGDDITPPGELATSSVGVGQVVSPRIPNTSTESPNTAVKTQSTHLPTRLSIPSIGVNAAVQYVGTKSNGQMANPSNFTDVGWFKSGTVPGEAGSAVMAGHVDNALALSGVFKHLKDVGPGDDIYVTRKDGKRLHFRVDDVEVYGYQNAPAKKIFTSSDGEAHLNLITCTGVWIKSAKSYSQRLVVYSTLVD